MEVYPVRTLREMAAHLKGDALLERHKGEVQFDPDIEPTYPVDFKDIKGQEHIKLHFSCQKRNGRPKNSRC